MTKPADPPQSMLQFIDERIDLFLDKPALWGAPEGLEALVYSHLQMRAFQLGERNPGAVMARLRARVTTMMGHNPRPLLARVGTTVHLVEVLRVLVKAEREDLPGPQPLEAQVSVAEEILGQMVRQMKPDSADDPRVPMLEAVAVQLARVWAAHNGASGVDMAQTVEWMRAMERQRGREGAAAASVDDAGE